MLQVYRRSCYEATRGRREQYYHTSFYSRRVRCAGMNRRTRLPHKDYLELPEQCKACDTYCKCCNKWATLMSDAAHGKE